MSLTAFNYNNTNNNNNSNNNNKHLNHRTIKKHTTIKQSFKKKVVYFNADLYLIILVCFEGVDQSAWINLILYNWFNTLFRILWQYKVQVVDIFLSATLYGPVTTHLHYGCNTFCIQFTQDISPEDQSLASRYFILSATCFIWTVIGDHPLYIDKLKWSQFIFSLVDTTSLC